MLKRLSVKGYKSLHDVDVELAPMVVLFGPNAAGKSNFLEAILLFSRLIHERTLGEAFAPPLRGYPLEAFTLPPGGLPALLSQPRVGLTLDADLELSRNGGKIRYRVAVEAIPRSGEITVADEYLARLRADGQPKYKPRIEREGDSLVVRRQGEAGQPRKEPLGLNHTLASNPQFSGANRYPDLEHLRQEISAWRSYYLDPANSMRTPQPPRDVSDIGTFGQWLAPFLYRLKGSEHAPQFDSVRRALKTAIPSIDDLDVDLDPERGTLDLRVWQSGTAFSSRVISEGTLRVLALCSIAANPWPSRLVAFEEPENGVHPRRIEVIGDLLIRLAQRDQRQVIITTHSPILVAHMFRRAKEAQAKPAMIQLLSCIQEEWATRLVRFDPEPLWRDAEIRAALKVPEEEAVVQGLLLRGWLDG